MGVYFIIQDEEFYEGMGVYFIIQDEEFYEGMGVYFVALATNLGYGLMLQVNRIDLICAIFLFFFIIVQRDDVATVKS